MLQNSFPKDKLEIPAYCRPPYVEINEYLLDGRMVPWTGNVEKVLSPIFISDTQVPLGHYPLMEEQHSLAALDAAKKAYCNGRGEWPSMHVSERIKCVFKFVEIMKTKRDAVVNLIMWEICDCSRD